MLFNQDGKMFGKKILFVSFFLLGLLLMASVSASDINDMAIGTNNNASEELTISDEIDHQQIADGSDEIIASPDTNQPAVDRSEEDLLGDRLSFTDLQRKIDDAGENDEIVLNDDYALANGGDTIKISKNITINGNGVYFVGDDSRPIINISASGKSVTLKNIVFIHGGGSKGGAILNAYSSTTLTLIDCEFSYNQADTGGAVYSAGDLYVSGSQFKENTANDGDGGAIYCEKQIHISDSEFADNAAGDMKLNGHSGGAIYSKGKIYMESLKMDTNTAKDGSAIYACDDLTIFGTSGASFFRRNEASFGTIYAEKNVYICWEGGEEWGCSFEYNTHESSGAITCEGNVYAKNLNMRNNTGRGEHLGAAIHCEGETHINGSSFSGNFFNSTDSQIMDILYARAYGGAIWSQGKCYIDSCQFDSNFALKGAAIYACDDLEITGEGNRFANNELDREGKELGLFFDKDGGAIYCCGNLIVNNSEFINNNATIDGGAIYCEKNLSIYNCKFENNNLTGYLSRKSWGGAICTDKLIIAENCSFYRNNATPTGVSGTSCAGGAVYVKSGGYIDFISCIFEANECETNGGAIYLDSDDVHLKVDNCTFNNNIGGEDGGAIYCPGETAVSNSTFTWNQAIKRYEPRSFGGAIRSKKLITVDNCVFNNNFAINWGGAIYADKEIRITDSSFYGNSADAAGAVYASTITQTVSNSEFRNNRDYDDGGALYIDDSCSLEFASCKFMFNSCSGLGGAIYFNSKSSQLALTDCTFDSNSAKEGGAVYAHIVNKISNTTFRANEATDGDAGGIYINRNSNPEVTSSTFEFNKCTKRGGGIYLDSTSSQLKLSDCTFNYNSANEGGGVYAHIVNKVSNTAFNNNKATGGDGGGIYINRKCNPEFASCSFENNTAKGCGGAIYLDSVYSYLKLSSCTFTNNSAASGGAVYAHQVPQVIKSVFLKNSAVANDGNGGALYIKNNDPENYSNFCEFTSCRFEENKAGNIGGAIYQNSKYADLKISYCTFVDNHADKKDYGLDNSYYYSPGHSIYNTGSYKSIDMCWFGTNSPDFKGQLAEYHTWADDEDHKPSNYLRIYIKLNESSDLYVGNPYKVIVYFQSTKGNSLSKDLLHSNGTFYGDGEFSNAKVDLNDMTAYVVLTKENPTIFGKLDHQIVSLSPKAKEKNPSEVIILSCANVTYPDSLQVSYKISNMSDNASYMILNSKGSLVKEGKITSPESTLTVGNLDIGDYSIKITNPETWTTKASNATAGFKVSRAVSVNVTADNVTYGNPTTITLKADYDGAYTVKINDTSIEMNVVDGICQKQVSLDAGDYQTLTSSGDYLILNCNEASFTVDKAINNAVVNVKNVTYGASSIITINADVDGTYALDVNGTKYDVTVTNGVGSKSIKLNAGKYYANVSFDNSNYNTIAQNATFTVYKADIDLVIVVFDEVYGDEIEGIVYADKDGDYNLTIAGYTTTIKVKDNFAYFEHTTLDAGSYQASVSFSGDSNYNPAFNITIFTVYPAGTLFELDINASEIIYGENATVTHILPDSATGNISYYLGDGTFLGVLNVTENLTLHGLDAGTYVIIGNYSGDHNFIPATDSTFLTVKPALNNVAVTVSNVTYGNDTLIEISADADGTYQLDLNGTRYNMTVENGYASRTVRLNAGKYYANASFNNGNYNTTVKNATFEVYKADIDLSVAASDIVYLEELKGIIYSSLDGDYSLSIGSIATVISVTGGQGEFNLGILNAGSYELIANYSGDENHNPAGYKLPINVAQAPNNALVTVDNVTYGELATFVVSADADGTYQLDINGTVFNVTVSDGSGNMSIVLDAGIYYANITFDNRNYNTSSINASFEVYKANVDLFVSTVDTVYPEDIEGIIYSNVDGEYNLTICDWSTKIYVMDSFTFFDAGVFDAGEYTVTLSYPGDGNHNPASHSVNITVEKFAPELKLDVSDINYGDVENIGITCDIPGSVNITVNGITETLELNGQNRKILLATIANVLRSSNTASLSLYGLNSGSYPVTVTYNGDKNHESVSVSAEFKVNPLNVTMDVDTDDINVGDDEKITISLSLNVTGNVTVTVDGKKYTAQVKDGKAALSIPNLSAGNKKAEVYYSGDENHNPARSTVSFSVSKLKPDMSAQSNEPFSGEVLHIVVKLPDDATGTVTMPVGGKKYTSPVKNGKAVFDIPGLEAGKYLLTAYYSGDDKYEADQIDISVTVRAKGNSHNQSDVSPGIDIGSKVTGNPILALLLTLIAVGLSSARKSKK